MILLSLANLPDPIDDALKHQYLRCNIDYIQTDPADKLILPAVLQEHPPAWAAWMSARITTAKAPAARTLGDTAVHPPRR